LTLCETINLGSPKMMYSLYLGGSF
jgi:hypothetical protein